MKKGFTLVEILVAVMIVTILVAMAVPMYEKTIEKSRLSEAYSRLKQIYDAKVRLMDEMEITTYTTARFGLENLDYTFNCSQGHSTSNSHRVKCATEDFTYVIDPIGTGQINFVCAARRIGDNAGVNFLYGVDASGAPFIKCNQGGVNKGCEAFGLHNEEGSSAWCTRTVDVIPATPASDENEV